MLLLGLVALYIMSAMADIPTLVSTKPPVPTTSPTTSPTDGWVAFESNVSVTYANGDMTTLATMPVSSQMESMSVRITWNDQGSGTQLSHVFLNVTRAGASVYSRSLFGVAHHTSQTQTVCHVRF